MRLAVLVAFLAGCQLVFPLEAPDSEVVPFCAEAIGHDEDLDNIDDACDLCPTEDVAQVDADQDGIGDACDPAPMASCEQRVLFEGFAAKPPFLLTTDGWVHDRDDMLRADSATGNQTMLIPSRMFRDVRFRASVTLIELDPLAMTNAFSLVSGSMVSGDLPITGYSCGIARNGKDIFDVQIENVVTTTVESVRLTGSPLRDFTFEIVNRPGGVINCTVSGGGQVDLLAGVDMASGEVVVLSDDIAARVHWIEVIANTCPP